MSKFKKYIKMKVITKYHTCVRVSVSDKLVEAVYRRCICHQCMNVCKWVNVDMYNKMFKVLIKLGKNLMLLLHFYHSAFI